MPQDGPLWISLCTYAHVRTCAHAHMQPCMDGRVRTRMHTHVVYDVDQAYRVQNFNNKHIYTHGMPTCPHAAIRRRAIRASITINYERPTLLCAPRACVGSAGRTTRRRSVSGPTRVCMYGYMDMYGQRVYGCMRACMYGYIRHV